MRREIKELALPFRRTSTLSIFIILHQFIFFHLIYSPHLPIFYTCLNDYSVYFAQYLEMFAIVNNNNNVVLYTINVVNNTYV